MFNPSLKQLNKYNIFININRLARKYKSNKHIVRWIY